MLNVNLVIIDSPQSKSQFMNKTKTKKILYNNISIDPPPTLFAEAHRIGLFCCLIVM